MWDFYGNLWVNGGVSSESPIYLVTVTPSGCPISPRTVARIRTHVLEVLSAPKAQVVPCLCSIAGNVTRVVLLLFVFRLHVGLLLNSFSTGAHFYHEFWDVIRLFY